MSYRSAFRPSLLTAALLATTAFVQGATQPEGSGPAATPAVTHAPPLLQRIKQPVSWLKWGGDLRVRNEYFNNLLTLDSAMPTHEQDYFRFRARIWTSVTPIDDVSLNARLSSEPREWMETAGFTAHKGKTGLDWTDGVIDALNVQWRNVLNQPFTITVGRQDIFLGDGWLMCEGTPNDGSWTLHLDAARLNYEWKEAHTTFELIGIAQNAKDDAWLPTVNDQNRYLGDQNENGLIFSVANTSVKGANVTGYFLYKRDDRVTAYGDNAEVYTLGGRLSGLLGEHWKYSAEGAYQFGWKQDSRINFPAPSAASRSLDAYGFNSKLTWLAKGPLNNQLNFAFEFLSGDDPGSQHDEMFDSLWGRWPRWSEIGLYSYAAESRIGQQANLIRFGPGWSISPIKDLDFSANYFALFAPEATPTRQARASLFSGDGHFRGNFVQGVLKYRFNPHVSGHLWGECLFPGDFYTDHTPMTFLRAEVTLTF